MIRGERCGFTEIRSNSLFINSNTTIRENTEHIMSVFDVMKKMTPEQLAEVMSNSAAEMEQMKFENE